jgi:hypothetical protein
MAAISPPDELEAAYREQRRPRFACAAMAQWSLAIQRLLGSGHLRIAEHAARHLSAAFPTLAYARNLCAIFDRMPRLETPHAIFEDDPTKDVQVVARNSDLVVLLFTGNAHAPGLPLPLFHPWVAQLPATLVYLRDLRRINYLQGVPSLGPTRAATLSALRNMISSLHGRRIVCYGNSGGVFAALDYGLELGAEKVLCMSGATSLSPASNIHTRYRARALTLKTQFPDLCLDMREAYSRAANPPRVCIVYGKDCWDDRIQAELMSTLSCVTLYGLENCGEHNVITEVIPRGEYENLLNWLIHPPGQNLPSSEFEFDLTRRATGKSLAAGR